MKKGKKKVWILASILALIYVRIAYQNVASQTKENVETFYKGKTIKFLVPFAPGGAVDLWVRALAPYLEKHTGSRILVENIPGAGGLVGSAQLYSLTKPDGLTIGVQFVTGLVLAEMLELEGAKFEFDKFTYIGRIDVIWRILFASKASGFKSIEDMQKAVKPIRFGVTDKSSASAVDIAIMSEAFSLKSKIIPGYKGSREYMLAVAAGRELDGASAQLIGFEDYVEKGDIVMVAVQGPKRFPKFPRVPTVSETPVTKEGKKLLDLLDVLARTGRVVLAPPGLPEEKRLFLEKALIESLKEPALVDWAKKNDLEPSPFSGNDCRTLISQLKELIPKAERPKFKYILTEKFY
jgi:tripartite-type tricarboxylate transporter receptor subunit TctC